MHPIKTNPPIKHGMGDPEAVAKLLYSPQVKEIFTDDVKDEEKTVRTVRDQGIGQDGMCAPAASAPDPGDSDSFTDGTAVEKIEDIAFITGKRDAASIAPAVRAGLQSGVEILYLALIKAGCRTFYKNQLASKDVLSYHSS